MNNAATDLNPSLSTPPYPDANKRRNDQKLDSTRSEGLDWYCSWGIESPLEIENTFLLDRSMDCFDPLYSLCLAESHRENFRSPILKRSFDRYIPTSSNRLIAALCIPFTGEFESDYGRLQVCKLVQSRMYTHTSDV